MRCQGRPLGFDSGSEDKRGRKARPLYFVCARAGSKALAIGNRDPPAPESVETANPLLGQLPGIPAPHDHGKKPLAQSRQRLLIQQTGRHR